MTKRIFSILIAGMIAIGTLAACNSGTTSSVASGSSEATNSTASKEDTLDPVTLNIYMRDSAGSDDNVVAEAISNLDAVKALNVTVKMTKNPQGNDYAQASTLALSSGEDIDILFDAAWLAYSSRVNGGAYADISELLNTKYTKLKDTLPEALWKAATVKGGIYCVPTYKEIGESYGLYVPADFAKENNFDTSKVTKLSDATELLELLVSKGHAGFMVTYGDTSLDRQAMLPEYDVVDGNYSIVLGRDDGAKVENYFTTQNFADYCKLMKSWYDKGLIAKDVLTKEDYKDIENDATKFGMTSLGYAPQAEAAFKISNGFDVTYMPISGVYATTNNCLGSVWAVSAKSKNIDRAVAFLEAWNTDPAVKNMITYGIEGKHYDLVDGQVDRTKYEHWDEAWYCGNWASGNNYISYTTVGETKDKWDVYKQYSDSAINSQLLGFSFDTSKVEGEYAAVSAVIKEYLPLLSVGVVDDVDAKIKDFNSALNAAGMETLVQEAQTQVSAFQASK